MVEPMHYCFFLQITSLAALCTDPAINYKFVCKGNNIEVFENITSISSNIEIILYKQFGNKAEKLALGVMKDFNNTGIIEDTYKQKVSLENGNILLKDFQSMDEGTYVVLLGYSYRMVVQLCALNPPNLRCQLDIKQEENVLFASLKEPEYCGKPLPSVIWMDHPNSRFLSQDKIEVLSGNQPRTYTACIKGGSLECITDSSRYCKNVTTKQKVESRDNCCMTDRFTYEDVRPFISLQKSNTDDRTITLQCLSNGYLRGIIRWRRNGILVTNNAKYSQADEFLVVRYPNPNDIHDRYSCFWSECCFESHAFSLETSGPSFIEVIPSTTVVKESDNLNISCLNDCYPLCSVTWIKTDPFSGYVNTLLKNGVLRITNITRKMSGNYICKVQNVITGASAESSVSLDIQYGPEEIVLNTSSNVIKLAEFDSITIRCTAECFPSCFVTWTKDSVNKQIRYAEMSLINVSSNGTYTCYAWNPSLDGPTLSKTIIILIAFDETLIPRISVFRSNASDYLLVLQCHSFRNSKGKFSWMVNGSLVKHNDKYSPINDLLYVRHLRVEDQKKTYTCTEPGSNLQSDPFRIDTYGPEEIVLNTSSNVIKLAEFDSITIRCTAECFPSCFFTWTKQSVNKQIGYAELSLINVSSNGTYTCYAWNPSHDGPTLQQTINILIEYDTIRQKISPTEHSPDTNSNMYDYPTIRYLMYALPVIGGLGLISTIVYCLRKKYTSRSRVTQVSMNPMNERPREGESNQDQTLHYWTIDPNAINSLRTSVQSDVDVELRQIFDSTTKTTLSQTCEGQASSNSGYIEVVSTFSDSFQLDGYINPINYDITQVNGTTSPRESSSIDCNEYLNPVHSNICEIELDPTDPNYKEASGSVDSHILSHSGDHDRDSVSACSNALECDDDLDQLPKPPRRN